jgi:hypothetical protein
VPAATCPLSFLSNSGNFALFPLRFGDPSSLSKSSQVGSQAVMAALIGVETVRGRR